MTAAELTTGIRDNLGKLAIEIQAAEARVVTLRKEYDEAQEYLIEVLTSALDSAKDTSPF